MCTHHLLISRREAQDARAGFGSYGYLSVLAPVAPFLFPYFSQSTWRRETCLGGGGCCCCCYCWFCFIFKTRSYHVTLGGPGTCFADLKQTEVHLSLAFRVRRLKACPALPLPFQSRMPVMKISYPFSCICLLKNLDFKIQRGCIWLTRSCLVLNALLGPQPCFGGTLSHHPSNARLLNTVLCLYFQYSEVGQCDVASQNEYTFQSLQQRDPLFSLLW